MSHLQLTTYGDVSPSTFEMDFATKLIKTQDLYERSQLDDATSPERANDIGYADTHRSSMQCFKLVHQGGDLASHSQYDLIK